MMRTRMRGPAAGVIATAAVIGGVLPGPASADPQKLVTVNWSCIRFGIPISGSFTTPPNLVHGTLVGRGCDKGTLTYTRS